eukprot:5482515-Prymnesium_polylepis.1
MLRDFGTANGDNLWGGGTLLLALGSAAVRSTPTAAVQRGRKAARRQKAGGTVRGAGGGSRVARGDEGLCDRRQMGDATTADLAAALFAATVVSERVRHGVVGEAPTVHCAPLDAPASMRPVEGRVLRLLPWVWARGGLGEGEALPY